MVFVQLVRVHDTILLDMLGGVCFDVGASGPLVLPLRARPLTISPSSSRLLRRGQPGPLVELPPHK